MKFYRVITLKDGRECILRSGERADGAALLEQFKLAHEETDFLLTYSYENSFTEESEAEFLENKEFSENEVEILAVVDGKIVGSAGIECVCPKQKTKHRAEFGISVMKAYWGLGIGKALTAACIECAKSAGYAQLELEVVAENAAAVALYKKSGFTEYGRNPKGMKSLTSGWQEMILMLLEL